MHTMKAMLPHFGLPRGRRLSGKGFRKDVVSISIAAIFAGRLAIWCQIAERVGVVVVEY